MADTNVQSCCRELNADDGVKSWTDFLKVYLHPQSLCLVPGMWQGACDFSGFGHGSSALSSEEFREDALDRVRLFAEECDALQVPQHASMILAFLDVMWLWSIVDEVQDRLIQAQCPAITAESVPATSGQDRLA